MRAYACTFNIYLYTYICKVVTLHYYLMLDLFIFHLFDFDLVLILTCDSEFGANLFRIFFISSYFYCMNELNAKSV